MIQILTGDALAVLRGMEAGGFHMCCTSPPYWGLRNYGVDGQLGLEADFEDYLAKLVEIFDEVKRVLRDDAVAFVNMGDGYASSSHSAGASMKSTLATRPTAAKTTALRDAGTWRTTLCPGLKPKDLIGQPWRLAFALRDAGWYLRSEIIWHKPNPMPESVEDRPTKAHEQIFLLTKSPRYFYDAEAVREPHAEESLRKNPSFNNVHWKNGEFAKGGIGVSTAVFHPNGRNLRTVWTVPSHAFSEAHFATFPPDLIIPCVKAGTSERGCCPACGAAWRRETEAANNIHPGGTGMSNVQGLIQRGYRADGQAIGAVIRERHEAGRERKTLGFRASCDHGREPVPCRVLDPFFGAGTTGLVADRLGRDCTGIELNPAYSAMAAKRLRADCPLFTRVEVVK